MRVEPVAHLAEGPPLDEDDFGLRHVAARQLLEQAEQRRAACDFIAAGLDRRFDAQQLAEDDQHPRIERHAGADDLACRGAHSRPGRDVEIDLLGAQFERRIDAPVKRRAADDEHEHGEDKQFFEQSEHRSGAVGRGSEMWVGI